MRKDVIISIVILIAITGYILARPSFWNALFYGKPASIEGEFSRMNGGL